MISEKDKKLWKNFIETENPTPEKLLSIMEESLVDTEIIIKARYFEEVGIYLAQYVSLDFTEALLIASLANYLKTDNKIQQAIGYGNLGYHYLVTQKFSESIRYSNASLLALKNENNPELICKFAANLGAAYFRLPDYNKAIEYHTMALNFWRSDLDKKIKFDSTVEMAYGFKKLGNFNDSIKFFENAYYLCQDLNFREKSFECCYEISGISSMIGNFGKAIDHGKESIKIAQSFNDELRSEYLFKAFTGMGVCYSRLLRYDEATEYHKKALEVASLQQDKNNLSICYGNLSTLSIRTHKFTDAINNATKALELLNELESKNDSYISKLFGNLCTSNRGLGNHQGALKLAKVMFIHAERANDKFWIPYCYSIRGHCYYDNDPQSAIENYHQAINLAKKSGDFPLLVETKILLSHLLYDSDPLQAYGHLQEAYEIQSFIGSTLIEDSAKLAFFEKDFNLNQLMVTLCMKLNKPKEAFEFLERGKSTSFLSLLSSSEINPTVTESKNLKKLIHEEKKLLQRLGNIRTKNLRSINELKIGEIDSIQDQLKVIYSKISQVDPEYVFLRNPKSISVDNLQKLFPKQKKILLVEYFISNNILLIFVLTFDKFDVFEIPIIKSDLIKSLHTLQKQIVGKNQKYEDIMETLGNLLILPISDYIKNSDVIYFVPHDVLHYCPLHALTIEKIPLIKNKISVYSPSASLIPFYKNKGRKKIEKCVVFGVDFPLEAEYVAHILDIEPHIDATKKTVRENLDNDVIHFSTHGFFNQDDPLSSGLKLVDGILTCRELFDLKLNAELVTLSACETGINELTGGDDLVGLTRSIIYAGASSVLVSLWEVDAKATEEIMKIFYNNLRQDMPIATALQNAQEQLMTNPLYSHPFYWAAFLLIGDYEK